MNLYQQASGSIISRQGRFFPLVKYKCFNYVSLTKCESVEASQGCEVERKTVYELSGNVCRLRWLYQSNYAVSYKADNPPTFLELLHLAFPEHVVFLYGRQILLLALL